MTFLELAQRVRQECGVAGTGPASVVGQSNEARRIVDWTAQAWMEIQGLHDMWNFMQGEFSCNIAISQDEITLANAGVAADHRRWKTDTFRIYRTADGVADDSWLVEWGYDTLRDTYRFGQQTPGRPVVFSIRPRDRAILLGPAADVAYTVYGEYQKRPVLMTADADVPSIREHHHVAIVYKAMEYYALYESASEVLERARRGYSVSLTAMEREELPDISICGPFA
jgi:hypothetical protein